MRVLFLIAFLCLSLVFAPLAGMAAPSCAGMGKMQMAGCDAQMTACKHCMKHQQNGKAGKCTVSGCASFQQSGWVMPIPAGHSASALHGPVELAAKILFPYSHTIPYQPPRSA